MSLSEDNNILDEETQKKYLTEYLELYNRFYSRFDDPTEAELKRFMELRKYVNVKITYKFDKAQGAADNVLGVVYNLNF